MTHVAEWFEIEDGYPTDDSLERLAGVDAASIDWWACFIAFDLPEIRAQMCGGASCVDVTEAPDAVNVSLSTAGWSGVEDVMDVIESKAGAVWFMTSWRRGGHYEFDVPRCYLPEQQAAQEPQP
jgi:hypothetical protein